MQVHGGGESRSTKDRRWNVALSVTSLSLPQRRVATFPGVLPPVAQAVQVFVRIGEERTSVHFRASF